MVTTRAFLTASSGIDLRGSTRGFWFAAIIFVVVMSGGVVGMAAADFDASESSVSATSPHVANGSDASTVTVLVNDTAGTPITGLTASNVSISLTGDAVVDDGFEETSEAGVYEFTVTNTEVETVTTTVTVDDSELGDQPETAFEPQTATIRGQVEDTTFETGIPNIEITAENGAGTYTAQTNDDGHYTVVVPGNDDSYTVSADPDGWDGTSTTTASVGDGEDVTGVDLELTGDADVGITWRDNRTEERLEGVAAIVESDSLGSAEFTGDDSGSMEFTVPSGPIYPLTASKDGYRDRTTPMTPGPVLNYAIGGNAELTGSVTDAESGGGVGGVTVTAENGAGTYSATTDSDGTYEIDVIPGDSTYDVTFEADGYESRTFTDEPIEDETPRELDAELTGTATISGTVEDELFETAPPGATVTISGEKEYVVETDDQGAYTATVAGAGQQYVVTADAAGWSEESRSVELDDGDTEFEFDFDIAGNAADSVTVKDALAGSTLEGTTIVVQNETLGEIDPFETDSDGMAELTPLPGGFTYTYTIAADGYETAEETTEIGDGETIDRELELTGAGSINGSITDDVTSEPIAGATVTVEYPDGSSIVVDETTDEDGAYTFTGVPTMGSEYRVSAEVAGYEDTTETVLVNGDEALDFSVVGDGALEVTTEDALFGDELTDASIELRPIDRGGIYEGSHQGDGTYLVENVPSEVEYELLVTTPGYLKNETILSLDESGTTALGEPRLLEGDAILDVSVTDAAIGISIENTSVTVKRESDGTTVDLSETTDDSGSLETAVPGTNEEYVLEASANGYDSGSVHTGTIETGVTETVGVSLEGDSTIEGTITDRITGEPIDNANVEVVYPTFTLETTTDAGAYEFTAVPGDREYEVAIDAAGYRSNTTTLLVRGTTVVDDTLLINREGSGTAGDPYLITDTRELQAMNAELDAHYVLEADLDASVADSWNDGHGFEPIGDGNDEFTGMFNGNSHTISNLSIERDESEVGLFGATDDGALLTNVELVDLTVMSASSGNNARVGGLVGWDKGGKIKNSSVTGHVTNDGTGSNPRVGGLAGQSSGNISDSHTAGTVTGGGRAGGLVGDNRGDISDSYSSTDVTGSGNLVGGLIGANGFGADIYGSYTTGTVDGHDNVGGLVGSIESGDITESYATGAVDGNDNVGGLVGFSEVTISRSYATGSVDGNNRVGGLVGENGGTVENSYWDIETTTQDGSAGGVGLTTIEMKSAHNKLDGFDFENTWDVVSDQDVSYPYLQANPQDPEPGREMIEDITISLEDDEIEQSQTTAATVHATLSQSGKNEVTSVSSFTSSNPSNATVDDDGIVTGTGVGTVTITGSYGGQEVSETLTVTPGPSDSVEIDTEPLESAAGKAIEGPPAVVVSDEFGNPTPRTNVSVRVVNAAGAIVRGELEVETNESGIATFDDIVIETASDYTLEFTIDDSDEDVSESDNAISDSFIIEATDPEEITIGTQPDIAQTAGDRITGPPTVTVTDAFGNPTPETTVSVTTVDTGGAIVSGTTVETNSTGVATFNDLVIETADDYQLEFSIEGVSESDTVTSDTFTVEPADASVVTTKTQPIDTTAGESIAGVPTVSVTDTFGNPTSEVTVSVATVGDGGEIVNANTAETSSTGIATFDSLIIEVAGDYELEFSIDNTDSGVGETDTATTAEFTVRPAETNSIGIETQPTTSTAGDIIADSPSVNATDEFGNPTAGTNVSVNTVDNDDAIVRGETTVKTNTTGIATFDDLVIETAADYQLEFSINNAEDGIAQSNTTTSTTFTVEPADSNAIVIDTPPDTIQTAGEAITGPPTILATDPFNNPVSDVTVSVTVVDDGGSTVNDETELKTNSEGIAMFDDLIVETAAEYQLEFSIDNTDSGVSEPATATTAEFTVKPADANSIEIKTQPAESTAGEPISGPPTVKVFDAFDNPVASEHITVTINNSATLDGTLEQETNSTGVVVFDNLSNETANSYELTFGLTDDSTVNATSEAFEIIPTAPQTSSSRSTTTVAPPSIDVQMTDESTIDVTGGQAGDVIEISDETTETTGALGAQDNISVDSLSIELANTRDFWLSMETFEIGDSRERLEERTENGQSTVAATFETETGTVAVGYVTVTHNLESTDVANVTFEFRISQSDLDNLGLETEDLQLHRQSDRWTALPTEYIESDGSHYRFEASSPGFSSFAIGTGAPLTTVTEATIEEPNLVVGEVATTVVTVENRGEYAANSTIELHANGEVVDSDLVTTPAGETVEMTLSFEPTLGDYEISVDGVHAGQLIVSGDTQEPDEGIQYNTTTEEQRGGEDETDDTVDLHGLLLIGSMAVILGGIWRCRRSLFDSSE